METVTLINPFTVPQDTDDATFLRGWEQAADYMSRQPGFRASHLHRALGPGAPFRFINVAEWDSPAHFQAAVGSQEFRELARGAAPGQPSLYAVVRTVSGAETSVKGDTR